MEFNDIFELIQQISKCDKLNLKEELNKFVMQLHLGEEKVFTWGDKKFLITFIEVKKDLKIRDDKEFFTATLLYDLEVI